MKQIKAAVVIILVCSSWGKTYSQNNSCKVNLENYDKPLHIKTKISRVDSSSIDPKMLLSSLGVLIKCDFYMGNTYCGVAKVKSKECLIKRDGIVIFQNQSPEGYWSDELKEYLKKVKDGDTLIIKNISAYINVGDSAIDLSNLKNIYFNDISVTLNDAVKVVSDDEKFINEEIMKLRGFKKLEENYAEGYLIDRSLSVGSFRKKGAINTQRYQFVNSGNIDFDFTFMQKGREPVYGIYDNLKKKMYTVAKWNSLISKIK